MTEIYLEISKLSDKFRTMAYGLTTDENEVNESVQELMLYFLSMNQETLSNIWEKDKTEGIIRYGAVALRRALTSPRSNYYYKYKKYYNVIQEFYTNEEQQPNGNHKHIYNIPNQEIDYQWNKLEEIDIALEDLTWYDKKIFELYYYESNTLDSLAKKTGISRNSLFTTIDKVRVELKAKLNE
jgi:DNA-directed RNA polymerase specialized sigma24 family protein